MKPVQFGSTLVFDLYNIPPKRVKKCIKAFQRTLGSGSVTYRYREEGDMLPKKWPVFVGYTNNHSWHNTNNGAVIVATGADRSPFTVDDARGRNVTPIDKQDRVDLKIKKSGEAIMQHFGDPYSDRHISRYNEHDQGAFWTLPGQYTQVKIPDRIQHIFRKTTQLLMEKWFPGHVAMRFDVKQCKNHRILDEYVFTPKGKLVARCQRSESLDRYPFHLLYRKTKRFALN